MSRHFSNDCAQAILLFENFVLPLVYFVRTGLQRRMRQLAPHINCLNHRLALALKHLIPHYQELTVVDGIIVALWKFMKYSSAEAAIFQEAQEANGLKSRKLL